MIRIPISHRIKFNLKTPAESSQKIHGIIFKGGKYVQRWFFTAAVKPCVKISNISICQPFRCRQLVQTSPQTLQFYNETSHILKNL
jgi:hypothetical protein